MAAGAVGLYYNRNRWYSPHLGRFIQRDVNETALPIITGLAFNAQTLASFLGSFDGQALYAAGANLYAYLGNDPVNGADPLGLYYDPFEDVDEIIAGMWAERAEAAGNAMRFFEVVGEAAIRAAIEGLVISVVPGGVFLVGGYGLLEVSADIHNEGWSWDAGVRAGLYSLPFIGPAGKALGKAFGALGRHLSRLGRWGGRAAKTLDEFDELFRNPRLFFEGKNPDDVADIIGWARESGWTITGRRTGSEGVRLYKNDKLITYRVPGSTDHPEFSQSGYWKVSSGKHGIKRIKGRPWN